MFCIHCGKEIPDESTFCIYCGKSCTSDVNADAAVNPESTEDTSTQHAQKERSNIPCPFCGSKDCQPMEKGLWTCLRCGKTFYTRHDIRLRVLNMPKAIYRTLLAALGLAILGCVFLQSTLTLLAVMAWIFALIFRPLGKSMPYYDIESLLNSEELQRYRTFMSRSKILAWMIPVVIILRIVVSM